MKLTWFGHSCFCFTSENGIKVLTDPFNDQVGYELPSLETDIVTISHNHFDHDNVNLIMGSYKRINKPGNFKESDIHFVGMATYHDEKMGADRGENIVFKFTMDGINICHCGDLGHMLTEQQVKEIGHIDILLIPIGGIYTIDSKTASKLIKMLSPNITIPMHYKTIDSKIDLGGVEEFLQDEHGIKFNKQELELDKHTLSLYKGVYALNYKNL